MRNLHITSQTHRTPPRPCYVANLRSSPVVTRRLLIGASSVQQGIVADSFGTVQEGDDLVQEHLVVQGLQELMVGYAQRKCDVESVGRPGLPHEVELTIFVFVDK